MVLYISNVFKSTIRKKQLDADIYSTQLSRCLNTADLTLVGVGHMIGAGIYVYSGEILKNIAGPLAFISFIVAGLISMLVSLCYAELGSLIPKAGSTYTYTYVILGEFFAFIVGWNIIFEHLLASAALTRSWSGTIDTFFNQSISNWIKVNVFTFTGSEYMSEYPDIIAGLLVIVCTVFTIIGVRTNLTIANTLAFFNIILLTVTVSICFFYADTDNWTNNLTPYGTKGVISGVGTAMFAYLGFECIALASEEASKPTESVPRASIFSVLSVSVLYVLATLSLSLIIPYYLVDTSSPFPSAFEYIGVGWAKNLVSISSIVGVSSSMIAAFFALPRAVYAMAIDGLIFKSLARVHSKTQTPILASVVFGFFSLLLSVFINIDTIIESLSVGTLTVFIMVGVNVLFLRYKTKENWPDNLILYAEPDASIAEDNQLIPKVQKCERIGTIKEKFESISCTSKLSSKHSTTIVITSLLLSILALTIHLSFFHDTLNTSNVFSIILMAVEIIIFLFFLLMLLLFEHNTSIPTFQVPFVPILPILTVALNMLVILQLSSLAWMRVGIWLLIGIAVYFTYGIRNSGSPLVSEIVAE